MKTKRKQLDFELQNIFGDVYPDNETREKAVRDAKRTLVFIKQDLLYHRFSLIENEQ